MPGDSAENVVRHGEFARQRDPRMPQAVHCQVRIANLHDLAEEVGGAALSNGSEGLTRIGVEELTTL